MNTYLKGRLDGLQPSTHPTPSSPVRCSTAPQSKTTPDLSAVKTTMTPRQNALMIAGFYNIMYVNELLDNLCVEFASKLKSDTKIFRHGVKHWWGKFRDTKRLYLDELARIMGKDMDEFGEQADYFWNRMHPDFQILYYTVRRQFLKVFPDDKVDILVYMFIIGNTFTLARQNYYNWVCFYRQEVPVIFTQPGLYSLDVTGWVNRWNRFILEVCQQLKINEHLVHLDDSEINDALKIFNCKMTLIDRTIEAVTSTDPDPTDIDLSIDLPDRPPHTPIPDRYLNWSHSPD